MKHYQLKRTQHGIALVAAVMIIIIFAIMGMMGAQKAKDSEKIAGANVRYGTVFEAAEQSLRDAAVYVGSISKTPLAGNGSNGRASAENFNLSNINEIALTTDPSATIIWKREDLETAACGSSCTQGFNFTAQLDEDSFWVNNAIKSSFVADNIADDNYLEEAQTYTLIEQISSGSSGGPPSSKTSGAADSSQKGIDSMTFYLVTVKASGYTPGMAKTADNANENIIVQSVFAKPVNN